MAIKFRLKGLKMDPFLIEKMLQKSQFWSREDMDSYQLKFLRELYSKAKQEVNYYSSNEFKKIQSIENLNKFLSVFPVLSKKNIEENRLNLISNKKSKSFSHSTSGSTGSPMTYEVAPEAESFRIASNLRFYKWWGLNMYDRNVLIWRTNGQSKNKIGGFIKRMERKFLGRLVLDVFMLNDSTIFEYYQSINRFKPRYIRGYKSGIFELARLMEKHELKFRDFKLELAVVTAETLYEFEREFIETIFECKVANEYGSAEAGLFALECPHGSLHINEESVFIQTDSEKLTYVTELYNYSMPLINYKNEDRVVLRNDSCSCGRTLKMIETVDGRTTDFIELPNGGRVHSFVINRCVAEVNQLKMESIKKFNAIQKNGSLEVRIIQGNVLDDGVEVDLGNRLKDKIGSEIDLKIISVENIEREKSGKQRSFIRLN